MSDFQVVAVNWRDVRAWGCPYCGRHTHVHSNEYLGSSLLICNGCGKGFVMLGDGITKSQIGVGSGDNISYPAMVDHPRAGMPPLPRPDIHPEYFSSRGIGSEFGTACFVCGQGGNTLYSNIAAFVKSKEAGQRVVEMFDNVGVRLDYREFEPDWIQVKIMACKDHLVNLEKLDEMSRVDRVLTHKMVEIVKKPL